ncbi:translation initiation factor IF-5A [Candidatus Woesearchaeota archaeon]|nr:translation initiation factor IF-5A [Candidatus Woesearchaeota archaeon]
MATKQAYASSLKSGRFVVFDNHVYRVVRTDTSKTGKHGHAKTRIEAVSVLDGKKIIKIMPGHDTVDTPIIEKKTAQVLAVQGNMANLMDVETYESFELPIPEELQDKVSEGSQVIYWIMLDEKVIKEVK